MTFGHGVASGDPLSDSVVLWTRWTPSADDSPSGPDPVEDLVEIEWVVALDPALADVVDRGPVTTGPDHDYTVKVDVGGLQPSTAYWYRFAAVRTTGGDTSAVGRTRTAPAPGAGVARLRLGLVSCASYAAGWFHAYRNLARRDVDIVVHVGDYLYENGRHAAGGPRRHPLARAATLNGYRIRHALYKTDPDLQALHARHPVVSVWDDHELAGGAWSGGAHEHDPDRYGSWADRRAAAVQAYWEWMPVRRPDPSDPLRIHRMVPWGDLVDLALLDTRMHRDRPVGSGKSVMVRVAERGRSILGADQRRWLEAEVATSTARWRLIGSQVMLAPCPLVAGRLLNPGQWDGYPDEREWLYRTLAGRPGSDRGASDVAVLSGDIHSSWASDLPVGAEFVCPSVSSPAFADILVPGGSLGARVSERVFRGQNPHIRMVELRHHGYVVVDVTRDRIQADWWHLDTVRGPSPTEHYAGGWQLHRGRPGLTPAPGPAERP